MKPNTDTAKLRDLLTKKGRASAAELGTDVPTLTVMEKAGVVKRDGTIKTGKKGKPPAAWVIADPEATLPTIEAVQPRRERQELSQEHLNKLLAEVKGKSSDECTCVKTMQSITVEQVRALGTGCKDRWVCSSLDRLRRLMGV